MRALSKAIRFFLFPVLVAFYLAGCSERDSVDAVPELEDPIYRRAKDLLDRGMENEALENYLKLIQKRNGIAPESHLDAGNIYLNHLKDPISATYYFKRYKAFLARSQSPEARKKMGLVDDLIKTAAKEFAATFDAKVYQDPLERLKLLDTIEQLRSENMTLKRQLESAREGLSEARALRSEPEAVAGARPGIDRLEAAPVAPAPQAREASVPTASRRTHVIQSGDTLYKISIRYYGTGARWRELLDANRSVLEENKPLKLGMEIVIP